MMTCPRCGADSYSGYKCYECGYLNLEDERWNKQPKPKGGGE